MSREIVWMGNEHTNSSARGDIVPIVIVDHISAGTMNSLDSWFRSAGNITSSAHFGVAKDGRIHQYVKIQRMAWANGIGAADIAASGTPIVHDHPGVNPNLYSVSIEHEGTDGDLTPEQLAASVWLHRFIQQQILEIWGVSFPLDRYHVIGHFMVNPVGKPFCPGAKFPWERLFAELAEKEEDEDNMPMKLEQWQWDMMYKVMGPAYNADQMGWDWMQKIVDKTLTAAELAFLNTVLDGRVDRKIEV